MFVKYREWSELNKHYTITAAMFSNAVHKQFHAVTPKKAAAPNGKRVWRNLQFVNLKTPAQKDEGWQET